MNGPPGTTRSRENTIASRPICFTWAEYDATRLVGGRPSIELAGSVIELDTGHPVGTFERTVDLSEPTP